MLAPPTALAAAWLAAASLFASPAVAATRPASDTGAVVAHDTTTAVRRDPTDTAPRAPARLADRLTVHGYLTQGVAGLAGDVQFYGVTRHASGDFRYAALQARYALRPNDRLLVQLNHRRLGRSPITDFESTVNVNWAFYEHTFGSGTALKLGRVPIPRGIYNELRSVGVALPTYRPPVVLYDEGAYYSETINGAVATHTFFAERPWTLDVYGYGGAWTTLVYDTWSDEYSVARLHARNAIGAQIWVNTPLDGVRLGAAATRYDPKEIDLLGTSHVREFHASLDATRERGFARVEAQLQDYVVDDFYAGYVQLGARLANRLHGVVEVQRSRDTDVTYGEGLPSSYDWHRSDGLGLWYAFSPTLVAKVEHHWDRGIQLEQPGDPRHPPRFRYLIASLSASF